MRLGSTFKWKQKNLISFMPHSNGSAEHRKLSENYSPKVTCSPTLLSLKLLFPPTRRPSEDITSDRLTVRATTIVMSLPFIDPGHMHAHTRTSRTRARERKNGNFTLSEKKGKFSELFSCTLSSVPWSEIVLSSLAIRTHRDWKERKKNYLVEKKTKTWAFLIHNQW